MEYRLEPIKAPDFKDLQQPNYDILHDVISRFSQKVNRAREEQIIKALNENGYELDINNREELERFAKTRCELISFTYNDRKILKVDGKPICEWWDAHEFSWEGNKVTCVTGKPNGL